MIDIGSEAEDTIIRALVHEERRGILRIVGMNDGGVSYTELMGELDLPTGKLNYHLRHLEGLIQKNEEHRYILTPLGRKAVTFLSMIRENVDTEFEKYVKSARLAQGSLLHPMARSFLLISIASIAMVLVTLGVVSYAVITEGAPFFIYVLLAAFFALFLAVMGWLLHALRRTPGILRLLEKRLA